MGHLLDNSDAANINYTPLGTNPQQQSVQTKLQEYVSVPDYAGTPADQVTHALAQAGRGGDVFVPSEVDLASGTRAPNPQDAYMRGKSVFFEPPGVGSRGYTGGRQLQTLPGRDPALLQWGQERLIAAFISKYYSGVTGLKVALVGDSNTAGYVGAALKTLFDKNATQCVVTNYGVSGTTLSQWFNATGPFAVGQPSELLSYTYVMASAPQLIIMMYGGTNDPALGGNADTFIASLDAMYSAMRSNANGGVQSLAIVGCTSAMQNNGQNYGLDMADELYNSRVRAAIIECSEKYQTAFFDKNGRYPDAFTDLVAGPAQDTVLDTFRVHTQPTLIQMLSNDIFNFTIPVAFRSTASTNSGTHNAADGILSYPVGYSIAETAGAVDFPTPGFCITFRAPAAGTTAAQSFGLQYAWGYTGVDACTYMRRWAGGWGPWYATGGFFATAVTSAALIATYPRGFSMAQCVGTGFPADGFVMTFNANAQYAFQINFAYISGTGNRMYIRRASNAGWEAWGQCWINNLATVAIAPAAGFTTPGTEPMSASVKDDICIADGYLTVTAPGIIGAGTVIANLAVGYRPVVGQQWIDLIGYNGATYERIRGIVTTGGAISLGAASVSALTSISISYTWRTV